ncbi:MAG: AMP-binding protein [Deltaproteobacteria bacterium]|nr:AMP-binding protein [Deltaproteobacteria bacterium]
MSVYSEKPWTKSYKLGPFDIARTMAPYPKVPLFQYLDESARRFPGRPACLYLGRTLTYRELKQLVDRFASALKSLGVEKGHRVATILPTSPQFVISDYAIQKTGGVHVPCSLLHKQRDLVYEIGESEAETIICLDRSLDLVKSVRPETKLKTLITTNLHDFSSNEPDLVETSGACSMRDLIAASDPEPPRVDIDPIEDLASLVFTGGATGKPKGVMLTHFNLVSNTVQSLPWVMGPLQEGIKGKSSILIGIPTFHAYGHWAVRAAVHWGLQMILLPDPRDTDAIVQYLKKNRPFMAPLVPTQYMRLIEKNIGRTNTTFASGAAPLPPEVTRKFKKVTGMPITEAYGLTETGPLTHFNLSSFAKVTGFMPFEKTGSIGVPVVDTDVRVVDPVTGLDAPIGEVGELYVRGPQLMKGYWPEPGLGLKDGWLATGDLCRMDEDGYFFLVDRNKDMINVSGHKVYSTTVDEVLFEHPDVASAVCIGVPDPERPGSERVKAFVVLKKDRQGGITAQDLIAYCKEKLAAYAAPGEVEFREALPLTVTEKLFKKQLRDEEIRKQQDQGK